MYKNTLDWKIYESVTKYIYETLGKDYGVTIVGYGSKFKITGKSGVKHQIDVLTQQTDGTLITRTAIECKYLNKKITKDVVFKLSGIINDAEIEKGIIVSRGVFTDDALTQVKVCNNKLSEVVKLKI